MRQIWPFFPLEFEFTSERTHLFTGMVFKFQMHVHNIVDKEINMHLKELSLHHPLFSFFPLTFFLSAIFPSPFFYPHFPIRIRRPQVSSPRFTDPVAWVGSVQPKCTVLLSTWSLRNFKPEFLFNEKRPKFFQIWSSVTGYGELKVCF